MRSRLFLGLAFSLQNNYNLDTNGFISPFSKNNMVQYKRNKEGEFNESHTENDITAY